MGDSSEMRETLKSVFGFDQFRQGQEPVIEKLLAGESALAIFPTGAGKSLCYQLPALMLEGVTLVISPLIALMKDQIDFLVSKGVAAARLDSTLTFEESRDVHSDLRAGKLKLLYVAPERLANERFLQTLGRLRLSMLAVDEAHCISEWGHSFRPDYLKLAALAKELRVERVLALTATATPSVASDIAKAFGIAADAVVHTGFYRANLKPQFTPCLAEHRQGLLLERLRTRPRGPTIVYVTLQKTAEMVAAKLEAEGLAAKPYHAGLDAEVRHEIQDWFMASADAIVVATIAFGMGIDKRDIRYVYHYNLAKGLESYMQEIGRAGRDGRVAVCETFAAADDVIVLENFTFGDTPTGEAVASLVEDVMGRGREFDISHYELAGVHDIRPLVLETILTYLELMGILQTTGPFYSEYKFQPLRPSSEMLKRFDPERAEFLKQIFRVARRGKTWFALNLDEAMNATGAPRQRIVSALSYLEELGELKLQIAGARQGYRVLKEDADLRSAIDVIAGRFVQREERDTARIRQVLDLVEHEGCRWRFLLKYFGEDRETPCGHCDHCAGKPSGRIPAADHRSLGEDEADRVAALRAEGHRSLASPRQTARFLCGLPSPAASRERLGRHAMFGSMGEVPFREVLGWLEHS